MSVAPDHDDWSPPDEVDEYKLIRQLGRGTMGQVYLARDRLLDRLVAIKFITALEPEARDRFVVEARAAARIQHPNVVAVHRVGELNHRPYLITEYVRGQNLAELVLPLPWHRVLELNPGDMEALAALEQRHEGLLHEVIDARAELIAKEPRDALKVAAKQGLAGLMVPGAPGLDETLIVHSWTSITRAGLARGEARERDVQTQVRCHT